MHLTISISQSHNPFVNCNYKSIFKCAHHLRLSGLYENRNRCNNAGKDRARNSNGRREIAGKIRGQRTPQQPARVESFESAVLNRFHRLAPTFTPSRDPSRRRLCEGMRVRASLVGPVSFRFCLLFAVCCLPVALDFQKASSALPLCVLRVSRFCALFCFVPFAVWGRFHRSGIEIY